MRMMIVVPVFILTSFDACITGALGFLWMAATKMDV